MHRKTRVLVVDDSSFMRKSLAHILEQDSDFQVVGLAADGQEALGAVKDLRPDVVILDLDMPRMDGLTALRHIMAERPTPVLVLSGLNGGTGSKVIECMHEGAVDYLTKPSGKVSYDIDLLGWDLIAKVKLAAHVNMEKFLARQDLESPCPICTSAGKGQASLVVIGSSTGGPRALGQILSGLAPSLEAVILVVQHIGPEFVGPLAEKLGQECLLPVIIPRPKETVTPGRVYLLRQSWAVRILRNNGKVWIQPGKAETEGDLTPIDKTMASAAAACGPSCLGILLSGMGTCGARGLQSIKNAGGQTMVQDPATCIAPGMPESAIALGCVDQVVPLTHLASAIQAACRSPGATAPGKDPPTTALDGNSTEDQGASHGNSGRT